MYAWEPPHFGRPSIFICLATDVERRGAYLRFGKLVRNDPFTGNQSATPGRKYQSGARLFQDLAADLCRGRKLHNRGEGARRIYLGCRMPRAFTGGEDGALGAAARHLVHADPLRSGHANRSSRAKS